MTFATRLAMLGSTLVVLIMFFLFQVLLKAFLSGESATGPRKPCGKTLVNLVNSTNFMSGYRAII